MVSDPYARSQAIFTVKQIVAENTVYLYIRRDEHLPDADEAPFKLVFDEVVRTGPPADDDTRRAIVQLGRDTWVPRYLHWNDGRDLDVLDRAVDNDTFTDDDFVNAVKADYQETICDACGSIWPTLVIPPGEPYVGAAGLHLRKVQSRETPRCPKCGAFLRQKVVKFY